MECLSLCRNAPLRRDHPGYRIAEVRNPRGTYELPFIVERGRPQMTMLRVRTARWVTKGTNTHTDYVMFFAFPLQDWLHERASVLRYTYIVCLVYFVACLCSLLQQLIL